MSYFDKWGQSGVVVFSSDSQNSWLMTRIQTVSYGILSDTGSDDLSILLNYLLEENVGRSPVTSIEYTARILKYSLVYKILVLRWLLFTVLHYCKRTVYSLDIISLLVSIVHTAYSWDDFGRVPHAHLSTGVK